MKRELALEYLWKFIGLPYVWGGNNPLSGFDCSGLIIEVLQGVGVLKHKSDYSAAALSELFHGSSIKAPIPGALAFWGNPVSHVEMIYRLTPEPLTIGASGGNSSTQDLTDAIHQQAYVKLRPLRAGYVKLVDPFLTE